MRALGLLAALVNVPGQLGYPVLGALVGAESMGIPVPGETALIAAAIYARDGKLNIVFVIAIAAAGAIIGDNLGYLIGRKGGRALLQRPGPLLQHRKRILEKGEPFFARHGPKAVFLGRWVAVLRIGAAWLAGINRMHWPVFVLWNALGGIAWATSVGLAAYLLGPLAEKIVKDIGIAAVPIAAVLIVALVLWRRRQRRRAPRSEASQTEP
jgi:membrane protein DedA with SNARE-associated domain